ncbi:hypothetical protein KXD93_02450 [Mucilaginibacter sp. BJC16-A38]|nr:hypothetical protein [Mucilaginibacter phenanthrenivorans]MCR8556481.1 hypothetical protein [Mucilaginibacter phenanthrenivorans]
MQTAELEYTVHPTEIPGQFIHEYPNGRRVLVEIDPDTKAVRFIREL